MFCLLSRIVLRVSTRLFYSVWTGASALTFVLCAIFAGENFWLAQTGLFFILILLLVSGVFLLLLGIKDLIRDFRHFLQIRSHHNNHASL